VSVPTNVWYFAYGSNMQSATLRGRRGIDYRRALPARLPGWRLVIDKPLLFSGAGSAANIVPDDSTEVIGVLFEITSADLDHVDFTEGVLIGNYRRVSVQAHPLRPDTPPLTAFTLASDRRDPRAKPTTRYMSLLIEGALEHGLPEDYVEFLRSIPAIVESDEAAEMRALIDGALKRRLA
jgi:gamma-glutamylcyclotransferase